MNYNTARLSIVRDEICSTAEEPPVIDLSLERVVLDWKPHYVFYRGTLDAFDQGYAKVLSEHRPELVTAHPAVDVEEDTYGFIAGTVITTTRDQTPYVWAALPGVGHWYIEQIIRELGTDEEVARVMMYNRSFITNSGRIVSRVAARSIAFDAKQLLPNRARRQELYSDDLWEQF